MVLKRARAARSSLRFSLYYLYTAGSASVLTRCDQAPTQSTMYSRSYSCIYTSIHRWYACAFDASLRGLRIYAISTQLELSYCTVRHGASRIVRCSLTRVYKQRFRSRVTRELRFRQENGGAIRRILSTSRQIYTSIVKVSTVFLPGEEDVQLVRSYIYEQENYVGIGFRFTSHSTRELSPPDMRIDTRLEPASAIAKCCRFFNLFSHFVF